VSGPAPPFKAGGSGVPPPLLELLREETDFFGGAKRRKIKFLTNKMEMKREFLPKKRFELPPQRINVDFDRIKLNTFYNYFSPIGIGDEESCEVKVFVRHTKESNEIKWRAHQGDFIKFHETSSNFKNNFLCEFSRDFKISR